VGPSPFAAASVAEQLLRSPHPPFRAPAGLAYRAVRAAGGLVLLPSAAAFVDPLLSTGFPLALLGILRLARIVEGSGPAGLRPVARGARPRTLDEADAAAR
jgi:hypothetical protein